MPASRIAFALGDLMAEIKRIMPQDAEIIAELKFNPDTYVKVISELQHHYGQDLKRHEIRGGQYVMLGGFKISTVLGSVDAC